SVQLLGATRFDCIRSVRLSNPARLKPRKIRIRIASARSMLSHSERRRRHLSRAASISAVGQFAMQSAWMLGAERVVGIDRAPERLRMAEQHSRAETINFD